MLPTDLYCKFHFVFLKLFHHMASVAISRDWESSATKAFACKQTQSYSPLNQQTETVPCCCATARKCLKKKKGCEETFDFCTTVSMGEVNSERGRTEAELCPVHYHCKIIWRINLDFHCTDLSRYKDVHSLANRVLWGSMSQPKKALPVLVGLAEQGRFTPLVQSTAGLHSCILLSELFVSPSHSQIFP